MAFLSNLYLWISNIWNLKTIFDKYLPLIRSHVEYIETLKKEIEELKKQIENK